MCKTHRTPKFHAPRLSWYSFGGIWRPIQPTHLKIHEFHFFTKLRTKPSTYAVVHRPTWPCAKPTELKTFVHQDFHGIHLGTFGVQSNHQISKTTNFNFSQNSPPSHLAMPWCTNQLGHEQNPPNSKLSCTKTFMVFFWGHLEANPTLTSQKPRISFFHKPPHQAIYLCCGASTNLVMCKTHRTQNFRAPRLSWYSFGHIWRPIQPSHLKNHEFQLFTNLPTKPSSYAVVHRPTWPCAKPTKLKTFVHQDFHGIHLGAFGGQPNPHISKTTNFIFSQNSPPSHLAIPWCTNNFGHVQNPPNSKLLCTKTFMVFIWAHLEAFPTITFFTKRPTKPSSYVVVHRPTWPCAKPTKVKTFVHRDFHGIHLGTFGGQSNHHISQTTNFNFSQNSPPSHLAMPWCTDQLGHVQNPPKSKFSCTKTFTVLIWRHLEANPTITSQKP